VTPQDFIAKWRNVELTERSASQSHFIDLCRMLEEPGPTDADPTGEWYAFEKGAMKTGGGDGWADVWKRGHFAWEYKRTGGDLDKAYVQLQRYAIALEQPPLLIVADTQRIRIHTNWTNSVQQTTELQLDELADERRRRVLKWAFTEPDQLRPGKTRQQLTEEAAEKFVWLAQKLRERGHEAHAVAHFVNRMVFCMFAEDVGLLPRQMFRRMLEESQSDPVAFVDNAKALFGAMRAGGRVGFERVEWFNGGIFDDDMVLPLQKLDLKEALAAAQLDWSNIDPSIMGTLFERGLDPDKRGQLGAHYTDAEKIDLIVRPVIIEPLTAEWAATKDKIAPLMERTRTHRDKAQQTRAFNEAQKLHRDFIERLKSFRVLDPACGSGNFLYVALRALKDIEHRANLDAEALGLPRGFPTVGPECVKGIEINAFAAELARVSVWIGEIQWMQRNGFDVSRSPILKSLDNIECRDALLDPDGSEAVWPAADAIVGNPPFLGTQLMLGVLGQDYVATLRDVYEPATGGAVDLVTYWFAKALAALRERKTSRVGFVATQSIRRGSSQEVIRSISEEGRIFDAWDDEPWIVEGAAVRVSLVCFDLSDEEGAHLDGVAVPCIFSDLSAQGDLANASQLAANRGICFQGPVKVGAFDIDGDLARGWLKAPVNPNGRRNSDVLRPWANGMDLMRRPAGKWIIDFGSLSETEAALFELPFAYVVQHVKPVRLENRDQQRRENWWRLGRSGADLKSACASLSRVIVTPRVAKHRIFAWAPNQLLPDTRLVAIARDDDTSFGVLHSRLHEVWTLRLGGWHGVGNDPQYTPSLGFETFPFPEGLAPNIPAASYAKDSLAKSVAAAAQRLNELRENWLNPPDLVRREPEVVPGYPDRILPVDDKAAGILKKRTLTNLYNERPTWLANAHRDLDAAVAAAYGWPADLTDDQILERLFKLNQERAAKQGG
jgi:type II restriction/modification system DNA methylase subunit YeeA